MMSDGSFLAVDWGTTNRRVYRMNALGAVTGMERDDRGILSVEPGTFPNEASAIRERMGDLPMICAGMVGSNRGWAEVPYVDCPAGIDGLARAVTWIEPGRTAIVPGLKSVGVDSADVMRGEEVQLLGAVAAELVPSDALLCQPGTHCKWAQLRDNRIERFTTAITGELFSLLQRHSLLAHQMKEEVAADSSFIEGVRAAAGGDLLRRLFGVRADMVAAVSRIENATSYVSGLLIGSDVHARMDDATSTVHVLSDKHLGALYVAAIHAYEGDAVLVDSDSAFITGINTIWRNLQCPPPPSS